ncbi:MAG: glycosyltransferase [Flavitalea sp.]
MKGNILMVIPNDELDGAEWVLFQIACYYARNGFTVDVFFLKSKQYNGWNQMEGIMNLYFTTVRRERYGVFHLVHNLWKHAKDKQYLFAYTSHTQINGMVGMMRQLRFLKIKYFVARESTSIFARFKGLHLLLYKFFYWLGYKQTDLLICQTGFMKNQLYSGIPGYFEKLKKIVVLPNPVVLNDLDSLDLPDRPYNRKYLISAGRLIPEKGHDILINIFRDIAKEHHDLDLLILGRGAMKDELDQLIDKLELNGRVKLVGHVKNVYPYFRHAEACVMSSRIEGFPNVLLQMMSQNKRVVSTLCAGDIEHLEGLFTCVPDNSSELKRAVKKSMLSPCEGNRELFYSQLKERDISIFIRAVHEMLRIEIINPVNLILSES